MSLPIIPYVPEVCASLDGANIAVVVASTGSGKSSILPVALFQHFGLPVVVTTPTVASARRLYDFVAKMNPRIRVGFGAAGHAQYDEKTEVAFVTAGHAKNMLGRTGKLAHFRIIMLDEAHSLSLDYDIFTALLKHEWNNDAMKGIRMLISSATLNTATMIKQWEALATDIKVVEVDVPMYEIKDTFSIVDYAKDTDTDTLIAATVKYIVQENKHEETPGHFLVFCPGEAFINTMYDRLFAEPTLGNCDVFVAHASLPYEEVDRAFSQELQTDGTYRAIILATDIAETSVTLPGVAWVVDSGLQKLVFECNEIAVLMEVQSSLFAANQRRGRTGRTNPGICHRMYTRHTYENGLNDSYQTEILRSPLHQPVLQLMGYGKNPADVLTTVDADRVQETVNALVNMKLVSDDMKTLSPEAMVVSNLPVRLMLGRMLYNLLRDKRMSDVDRSVLVVLIAAAQIEGEGRSVLFVPRQGRDEGRNEYSERVRERRDNLYAPFETHTICPLNATVNVVMTAMAKHPKALGKWSCDNGLNNKTISGIVDLVKRLAQMTKTRVLVIENKAATAESFRKICSIVDLPSSTIFESDALDKWWAKSDIMHSSMFYRISRRGFGSEEGGGDDEDVYVLGRQHISKTRATLGFITVWLPVLP